MRLVVQHGSAVLPAGTEQFSAKFLDDGTPVFVGGGVEVLAGEDEGGSPLVWCPHSQIFASADRERVYNLYGQALVEWPRLDRYAVAVRNPQRA